MRQISWNMPGLTGNHASWNMEYPAPPTLRAYLNRQPAGALLLCRLFLQFCLQTRNLDAYFQTFPDCRIPVWKSVSSCTAETSHSGGHLLQKKRPIKWTELRALLIYSKAFYNTVVRHIFGGVWYVVKYWCIIGKKKQQKNVRMKPKLKLNDAQNKPHRCVPMCCLPQSPLRVTH